MEFLKTTALITDGGSGIGLSCAKLLLAQGANVVDFDLKAHPWLRSQREKTTINL
jgi:NAD(P)-dependent dehydrogenase (short-subunit alcohol dehydrogenase family)